MDNPQPPAHIGKEEDRAKLEDLINFSKDLHINAPVAPDIVPLLAGNNTEKQNEVVASKKKKAKHPKSKKPKPLNLKKLSPVAEAFQPHQEQNTAPNDEQLAESILPNNLDVGTAFPAQVEQVETARNKNGARKFKGKQSTQYLPNKPGLKATKRNDQWTSRHMRMVGGPQIQSSEFNQQHPRRYLNATMMSPPQHRLYPDQQQQQLTPNTPHSPAAYPENTYPLLQQPQHPHHDQQNEPTYYTQHYHDTRPAVDRLTSHLNTIPSSLHYIWTQTGDHRVACLLGQFENLQAAYEDVVRENRVLATANAGLAVENRELAREREGLIGGSRCRGLGTGNWERGAETAAAAADDDDDEMVGPELHCGDAGYVGYVLRD
jgi:hypothetical protein